MSSTIAYIYAKGSGATLNNTKAEGVTGANPLPAQAYFTGDDGQTPYAVRPSQPLPVTLSDNTSVDPNYDGKSRSRVVEPYTVFESYFNGGQDRVSRQWDSAASGAGAAVSFDAQRVRLTTVNAAETAELQSMRYIPFQPGCTVETSISGILAESTAVDADYRAQLGLFDANDGFYFGYDGNAGSPLPLVGYLNGGVATDVLQTAWNIDRLDGAGDLTNPSGVTLAVDVRNSFYIEYDFNGAGQVTYGIILSRRKIPCHRIDFGNAGTVPEIARASLPVRCSLASGTSTLSNDLSIFAASVAIDGGNKLANRYSYAQTRGASREDIDQTEKLLFILSPAANNRTNIRPRRVRTVPLKQGAIVAYRAYRYVKTTSGAYPYTGGADVLAAADSFGAAAQWLGSEVDDTGGDAFVRATGNYELLAEWYGGDVDISDKDVVLGLGISGALTGVHDIFVVTATQLTTGADETVTCTVEWDEQQ